MRTTAAQLFDEIAHEHAASLVLCAQRGDLVRGRAEPPFDDLALDLIATRSPEESDTYKKMQQVVWGIIDTAFSNVVITPGVTRTEDVVWWMRQKVNDLGLGTWFHQSVEVHAKA